MAFLAFRHFGHPTHGKYSGHVSYVSDKISVLFSVESQSLRSFFIIKHGQMLLYRSCSQKMCRMTRHYSSPTIKLGLTRLESTKKTFFQKTPFLSFLLKTFNFTSFVRILMPPIWAREWRSIRKLVKAQFSFFFFFCSFCWKSVEAEEELSLGREEEGVEDDDDYGQLWCPFFCYHQTVKTTMEMERLLP